jgi:hypothetical protein
MIRMCLLRRQSSTTLRLRMLELRLYSCATLGKVTACARRDTKSTELTARSPGTSGTSRFREQRERQTYNREARTKLPPLATPSVEQSRASFARWEFRRFTIEYANRRCSIGWSRSSSRYSMTPTSDIDEGNRRKMPCARCGRRSRADVLSPGCIQRMSNSVLAN